METYPLNVVFASYGNDSIALIQWVAEARLDNVAVLFSDTGWAADWWAERVVTAEAWVASLGFSAHRTRSEGMETLVYRKKGWPRQGMQFCTQHLKMEPALHWLDEHDPLGIGICMVGVRREESTNRAHFPEWFFPSANHGGRALSAPLAEVTEEGRDALLHRAGWAPLPHRSRECWPCVNESRGGLRHLDEATVAKVEAVEARAGFTSKGKPITMFRPYRHMGAVGIREVLRWAQSPHGKYKPQDDETAGCDAGWCGL